MQLKLSIITINFNNFEGLKRTAESIINQTWKDFEWIIIDGGSTDGSKEYIIDLNDNLSHSGWNPITYWCSESDNGIYNAMNKGIVKANGDYLNFMNSGDCFYENGTLEKVNACFLGGEADIYYGDIIIIDRSVIVEYRKFHEPLDLFDVFYNKLGHQAQYIRTLLLKNNSFDEDYKIAGDHAKNIEFLMQGYSFKHLPFYAAKFDNNGISSRYNVNTAIELKRIESEYFPNSVLLVLSRLYKYENGHIYQRVNNILNKGGILSLMLRLFLKIAGTKRKE
ncbi:MAG: glycosyltransferase [Prevotella sp.]|nr:glycosyltransferase [Prevotella sp.]